MAKAPKISTVLSSLAVLAGAVFLLPLARCDNAAPAPTGVGVCWRMTSPEGAPAAFAPALNGARNLETCAAHLETLSVLEKRPVITGAFQGQFIFITPEMIQSGLHLDGTRYRVFDASTRGKIDNGISVMLDDVKHPEPKPAP